MLTELDIASGILARNTSVMNAILIPVVLTTSMPITRDSGIQSIKILSRIASAALPCDLASPSCLTSSLVTEACSSSKQLSVSFNYFSSIFVCAFIDRSSSRDEAMATILFCTVLSCLISFSNSSCKIA